MTMFRLILMLLPMLLVTGLFAKESADYDVRIDQVERFQTLRYEAEERAEHGSVEYVSVPNQVLVVVDVTITPEWIETAKSFRIDEEEQFLRVGQEKITLLGWWRADGLSRSSSIYSKRKRNWKEKRDPTLVSLVFHAPADARSGTLLLGSKEVALEFAGPIKEVGDVEVAMEAKVNKTAWLDEMSLEYRYNRYRQPSVRKNPNGRILAVTFTVHPIKANSGDVCYWRTPWIGLLTEDGHYIPTFGEGDTERPSRGSNHTIRRDDEGHWESKEVTYYFAVPSRLRSFTITSLTAPIGVGVVQED